MARLLEHAAAKVNLTLEILGRRGDGYHELDSLVAFASVGDRLELDPDRPSGLTLEGPFAAGIQGTNLLDKTIEVARSAWPGVRVGALHLVKNLPVAAGLGGGSADAAACLRLLARTNAGLASPPDLPSLARRVGADVPVCLVSRISRMQGLGERVTPWPAIGPIPAVLVNPMVLLATAAVFGELAAAPLAPLRPLIGNGLPRDRAALIAGIIASRNDLEPPAIRLCPPVAGVLAALRATRGCLLARLSGSGATCFGLYANDETAEAAARQLAQHHRAWWVAPTRLH